MRKCIYLLLLVNLIIVVTGKSSFAQVATGDSSSQTYAFNNAINLFHASLGQQSPLYNGPEYYFYDPIIKGNAYFLDVNAFSSGSIFYDGGQYNGASMLYDLFSDKVVILLYNHFSMYSLLQERVKYFDFLDHHFINIRADTIHNNTSGLRSGYYDEIYNGKIEILVKRSKSVQTSTGGTLGSERYFSPSKDFYLKKNNTYYSITGESSLINVLKDRKKELDQFIKASQIKFRQDPEEAMVKIVTYYDHLTN